MVPGFILKILLAITFVSANFISPSLIKWRLSSAKVEKVVNPPRMPMKRNVLTFEEMFWISNRPHNRPINKEPVRFTAQGPPWEHAANGPVCQSRH